MFINDVEQTLEAQRDSGRCPWGHRYRYLVTAVYHTNDFISYGFNGDQGIQQPCSFAHHDNGDVGQCFGSLFGSYGWT